MKVLIGTKVTRVPITFAEDDGRKGTKESHRAMTGTVIYVHPSGRYHTVEFEMHGAKLRESFLGMEL